MKKVSSNKTTARIVGMLYLAGFVLGIAGNGLIQSILGAPDHLSAISANSMTVALGAMLWLLAAAGDAAHGVLMFPVLKPHGERVAFGYLAARIVEAVLIAVMVLFVLLQIPLGGEYLKATTLNAFYLQTLSAVFIQASQYTYQIGMCVLGLAGLLLCSMLYRVKLIPQLVAAWGLVGYFIFVCGSTLEIIGFDLRLLHTIPGGLWELFTGIWLFAKGFNPAVISSNSEVNAGAGKIN